MGSLKQKEKRDLTSEKDYSSLRTKRHTKKFESGLKYVPKIFGGLDIVEPIEIHASDEPQMLSNPNEKASFAAKTNVPLHGCINGFEPATSRTTI